MDPALARYAFRILVLLACVIAAWGGADQTPTREVVELVSVFDKPARIEAKAAGEPVNTQTVVQHAKAAPRQEPAPIRSAKTFVKVPSGVKNAVAKRTGARQARKEPPLPAMFVPIRKLGLYLQSRMGAAREGKAAPGNRKR